MRISESLIPELDWEMAHTRKTLERVPEEKFAWKPHEKSMDLGRLALHVATIPDWVVETIGKDSLDIGPDFQPPQASTPKELLDLFDRGVAAARRAIEGASDEHMLKPWTLSFQGRRILTEPRAAVIRTWVMNHNVHHRAQLGVYLRLNNIPVPAIYGPSADEGGHMSESERDEASAPH